MSNLPPAFESRMRKQLGQEADAFFKALNQPAPVSIRLNPIKTTGKIPGYASIHRRQKDRMVSGRVFLIPTPGIYPGPLLSGRSLLCSGSLIHVYRIPLKANYT